MVFVFQQNEHTILSTQGHPPACHVVDDPASGRLTSASKNCTLLLWSSQANSSVESPSSLNALTFETSITDFFALALATPAPTSATSISSSVTCSSSSTRHTLCANLASSSGFSMIFTKCASSVDSSCIKSTPSFNLLCISYTSSVDLFVSILRPRSTQQRCYSLTLLHPSVCSSSDFLNPSPRVALSLLHLQLPLHEIYFIRRHLVKNISLRPSDHSASMLPHSLCARPSTRVFDNHLESLRQTPPTSFS